MNWKYGYIAPEGFESDLETEVGEASNFIRHNRLLLVESGPETPVWSHNTWLNPELVAIESIGDAVKKLKARNYLWTHLHYKSTGRGKLILDHLPKVFHKPVNFGDATPTRKLGAFTLLSDREMIVSAETLSPFENGEFQFVENKNDPPSRAYLKLWEWMTITGLSPNKTEIAYDLGSCPGGWTWVLAQRSRVVVSVDKAPLDAKLNAFKNIQWIKKDAFSIDPKSIQEVDWVFSDIISEPERILELAQNWIQNSKARHLVFTVKFKGETKHDVLKQLVEISGAHARHLFHNKHEVTWWWSRF